jgi:heme/copper-type cytochrome/quinol oxidase subunit 2
MLQSNFLTSPIMTPQCFNFNFNLTTTLRWISHFLIPTILVFTICTGVTQIASSASQGSLDGKGVVVIVVLVLVFAGAEAVALAFLVRRRRAEKAQKEIGDDEEGAWSVEV